MEQKLVRAPFNIDMAKKITEKSVKGRIVTRDGRNARIACWNYKSLSGEYPLLVLIENGIFEAQELYTLNGKEKSFIKEACDSDLVLEIPEYMTFKVGDVVTMGWEDGGEKGVWVSIIKDIRLEKSGRFTSHDFTSLVIETTFKDLIFLSFDDRSCHATWARRSTEEEKHKLFEALKKSDNRKAKLYREMFFGIESSPEFSNSSKIGKEEFKPFDRVLVRQSKSDKWEAMLFSNYTSEIHRYRCGGMNYMFCIPYEGNEHLLDTTNDYKED